MPKRHFSWHFVENQPPKKCRFGIFYGSGDNRVKEFVKYYKNDAYLDNKTSSANQATSNAVYKGERRNFTLDTYYEIMNKAFNDLEEAGPSYALNSQ